MTTIDTDLVMQEYARLAQRVAELEAALREIEEYAAKQGLHPMERCVAVYSIAQIALVQTERPDDD